MARWQPGARDRMAVAAFELFHERGFEQTTVNDIAERAGVDKRTFYRHFGDKREALFTDGDQMRDFLVEAVREGDPGAPFAAVLAAFDQAADKIFSDRLAFARTRQAVITTSSELAEREALKMESLVRAIADALTDTGTPETAAALAAQAGISVFRVAFSRWVADGNERTLTELLAEVAAELRAVTALP